MTSLRQPSVTPATTAEWRRRREASTETHPPTADGQPGNGQPGNGLHPADDQPGNGLHPDDGQPGNGLHPDDGQPGNGLHPADDQPGPALRHVNGQAPSQARRRKWRPASESRQGSGQPANGLHPDGQPGNGQLHHVNGEPSNGFRVPAYALGLPPPVTAANDFAESQQAGLAAMLSIAKAIAPPQAPSIPGPRAPEPEPSAAPPDPPSAVPAQRLPDTAELVVLDRPGQAAPPDTAAPQTRLPLVAWPPEGPERLSGSGPPGTD